MILLVGMGFFRVSFGLSIFFQGLGFGFVQGDGLDFSSPSDVSNPSESLEGVL